jgi:hypothetical protein
MAFGTPGNKPNWAREIDSDNPLDMLGLTAAQNANFSAISGKAVVDMNGNKQIIIKAVATAATLTLTDYANFGVGSKIEHVGATVPKIYTKIASSSPGVAGDWAVAGLTVCTLAAVS